MKNSFLYIILQHFELIPITVVSEILKNKALGYDKPKYNKKLIKLPTSPNSSFVVA